jgi:hypothetical protein
MTFLLTSSPSDGLVGVACLPDDAVETCDFEGVILAGNAPHVVMR